MQTKYDDVIRGLVNVADFGIYLQLVKKILPCSLVFITVCDTAAGPGYTVEHAELMKDLGLKVNLIEQYRMPYIAIINQGTVIYEKCSSKVGEPLSIEFKLNHHEVMVYSAGFHYQLGIGCGALVMFDGVNYAQNRRGFNFIIFDPDSDELIDSCVFDTMNSASRFVNGNPCAPYLLSFAKKIQGVQLCTIQFPRFPTKHLRSVTPYEQQIRSDLLAGKNPFSDILQTNKEEAREIFEKKLVHFCDDFQSFEEFFDAFQVPPSYMDYKGAWRYFDYSSCAVHTKNGFRITTDSLIAPKRSIFVIGPSTVACWGGADNNTFESILQRKLNERALEKGINVYNCGFYDGNIVRDLMTLASLSLKSEDIVLFCSAPIWGISHCDLSLKSVRPHKYGDIFIDSKHYCKNGNQMIADGIFDFLEKNNFFEEKKETIVDYSKVSEDEHLHSYKIKLTNIYRKELCPKNGAVVMNCNPFTLGHRYLVEEALRECNQLIVFVVEEDRSEIPFIDRLQMVKENLSDLRNVFVIPSSKFIISTYTFAGYFNKVNLQDQKIDGSLDINLFGSEIAPCLNISVRFAGEEPFDSVTRQYNEQMRQILPQYGIAFKEISRLKVDDRPVSASYVRQMAKVQKFDKIRNFVPKKTFEFLINFYGRKYLRG